MLQPARGLGGLVVSALDFLAGYHGFESPSGWSNFQTISMPSSYSTCPGLSRKWTEWCLVTDSGTKCAWVIQESKAVQIHVHNNCRCLHVPQVPGSVINPQNNNNLHKSAKNLHFTNSAVTSTLMVQHINLFNIMIHMQGCSNEYPQSMFLSRNKQNNVYPL